MSEETKSNELPRLDEIYVERERELRIGPSGDIRYMRKELEVQSRERQILALQSQLALVKGAMAAQDERGQQAGEKCGVSWVELGCDWPGVVAEKVIVLRSQLAEMTKERNDLLKEFRAVSKQLDRIILNLTLYTEQPREPE